MQRAREEILMSKTASILVCGVFASILASGAQALPIAPARSPVKASEALQVRDFCGLGFHRDVYGRCLPNGVYVAPAPVVVAPAAPVVVALPVPVCPYGYGWAP